MKVMEDGSQQPEDRLFGKYGVIKFSHGFLLRILWIS
jgi:hypothetical protein